MKKYIVLSLALLVSALSVQAMERTSKRGDAMMKRPMRPMYYKGEFKGERFAEEGMTKEELKEELKRTKEEKDAQIRQIKEQIKSKQYKS